MLTAHGGRDTEQPPRRRADRCGEHAEGLHADLSERPIAARLDAFWSRHP